MSSDDSFLVQTSDGNKTDANLPEKIKVKTKQVYRKSYANFTEWRKKENMSSASENALLAYFQDMNKKYSPSTLKLEFSMLKTTLNIHEKIDISEYSELKAFLKQASHDYKTKKSNIFSLSEIKSFIEKAPDEMYLLIKVAMIFGIMGGCSPQELHDITCQDIIDTENTLIINIVKANKTDRTFAITGVFYNICKKYMDLRPKCNNLNFFIRYANGRCINQNIGINTFGVMGKRMAKVLKLPNPEFYTGHCFRRTSKFGPGFNDRDCLLENRSQTAAEPCNEKKEIMTGSSNMEENILTSAKLREPAPEKPGPSKITYVDPNEQVDPLSWQSERCRFCYRFSEECIPVSPNFLAADKTTLAFNDIQVQIDFTDNPNVCKDCDIKLQIMYDFVKDVKAAQESLVNIEAVIKPIREDIGLETVMFKTKDDEDNDEYDSPDEDDNDKNYDNPYEDDNDKNNDNPDEDYNDKNNDNPDEEDNDSDNDTKEGVVDSLTVSETKFIKQSVSQKRKPPTIDENPKKAKFVEKEYNDNDFVTDIKAERIETDITNDANNKGFRVRITLGTDGTPYLMRNDGIS